MATKKPRYMISVTNEMFKQIEDFRFKNRFQTRSEATTELLRIGIEEVNKQKKQHTESDNNGKPA